MLQTADDWPRNDPNASTNAIASLRSDLAKKDHQIAQIQTELDKTNKRLSQSTTLVNTLQRESATKDNIIRKHKTEEEKYRRQIREKESQISTLSAKVSMKIWILLYFLGCILPESNRLVCLISLLVFTGIPSSLSIFV